MKKLFFLATLAFVPTIVSAHCPCPTCPGRMYGEPGYESGYNEPRSGYYREPGYRYSERYMEPGYRYADPRRSEGQRNGYAQQRFNAQSPDDRRIAQEIERALNANRMSRNIEFDVNEGNVTLYGEINSNQELNQIKQKIQQINGVTEVESQVQIRSQSQMRTR